MNLTIATRELHPRAPFRISRARRHAVRNVFVRLQGDGIFGYGEASPNAFYSETAEGVTAKLEAARGWLATLEIRNVEDLEAAWLQAWRVMAPSRAAQCALDLALWDWLGKKQARSAAELAWGRAPEPVTTFCTLGLSTEEELPHKIEELQAMPRIKIKSDSAASLSVVNSVRECSNAMLAVDANCAWREGEIAALSCALARLGVEFIEQPLPPACDSRLLKMRSSLPIFADESCAVEEDVAGAARCYDGFNLKLVKCGGITPARRMVQAARELGKQLMVGCMLESSALVAAGAVIAQRTDYADLDGAWLLRDDPFSGWQFREGVLFPSAAHGLGIEPQPDLFGD